jgi:hypothetical protein
MKYDDGDYTPLGWRVEYVPDEMDRDPITLPGFMVACVVTIVPMFLAALGAVCAWRFYYG